MIFISLLSINSYSQTYYYKQTKTVKANGSVVNGGNGGQFITFKQSICFESNKKGIGVGHGVLEFSRNYSDKFKTYVGNSYWGKETVFRFSQDLTRLNVCLDNGTVYVYSKATPPANQATCSLIRPKSSSGGGGGNIIVTPIPGGSNGTISGSSTNQQPRNHEQEKRDILNKTVGENCGACKGSGKCHACNGTKVAHSMGNTYTCTVCDRNGNCGACNGTGKTLWNR